MKKTDGKVTEEIKSLTKQIRKTSSQDHYDPNSIRVSYVRYADDWVIGITGPKSLAIKIRERAQTFLEKELKLTLSMEKTKITNLRKEEVSFLGFVLSVYSPKESKVTDYIKGKHSMKRRASHGANISVEIPVKDIVNRLRDKNFCDANYFPIHHNALLSLDKDQIVAQYNAVLRGITNYYAACGDFHKLSWVEYILRFSLAKTLANKERTSMRKQFQKRGKYLTVQKTVKNVQKTVQLVEFRDLKRRSFSMEKQDLNRAFKLHTIRQKSKLGIDVCVIKDCQSGKLVEMHHVKHIRKMGKTVSGFTKLMAKINRKQVPLCIDCHQKVHKGTYDGLALKQLDLKVIYN